MSLSRQLQAFQKAIDAGNIASAQRQLRFAPWIAREHAKNDDGYFVSALDLAMNIHHPELVDMVLYYGARMDLPVGPPPKYNSHGATSMTKALSLDYVRHPNSAAILQCMARHHGERARAAQNPSVLTRLSNTASGIWDKVKSSTNRFLAGQFAPIATFVAPASGILATASMMGDKLLQPGTGLAAIAGFAAAGAAGAIASKVAEKRESAFITGDNLGERHAHALSLFDEEARDQMTIQAAQRAAVGLPDTADENDNSPRN